VVQYVHGQHGQPKKTVTVVTVFVQMTMKLYVAIMVEVEVGADKVHTQSKYTLPFLHAHLYVELEKDNNRHVMVVNYARAIILEKSEMSH